MKDSKNKALKRQKEYHPEFVNTWRERYGSNEGLHTPAADKAHDEFLRRKRIDEGHVNKPYFPSQRKK